MPLLLIFPFFYIITYLPIGRQREIEIVSFELEKAYNKVPRKLMWWVLEHKGIPLNYGSIYCKNDWGSQNQNFNQDRLQDKHQGSFCLGML